MTRARRCRKCGCTDKKACIEFDANGRGYGCYRVAGEDDLCSACLPEGAAAEQRMLLVPPLVVAPQLAGMVARPRHG